MSTPKQPRAFKQPRVSKNKTTLSAQQRSEFRNQILRELWQGKLTQGQALKRLRIEMLGLKQAQFAKLVGVSLPSLSNLENDRAVSAELFNKAFKPFGLGLSLVPTRFDEIAAVLNV